MEFDKLSTKYLFYAIGSAIVLALIWAFTIIIRYDMKNSQEYESNKEACSKLKFGDELTATDGFFQGIKGTAVDIGRTTVRIQYLKGLLIAETDLKCSEVRKL